MMAFPGCLTRLVGSKPCCSVVRLGWRLKHSASQKQNTVKAGRILLKPPAGPSSVLVKAAAAPTAPTAEALAAGFKELGISSELLAALQEKSILHPTEIQVDMEPSIDMAMGPNSKPLLLHRPVKHPGRKMFFALWSELSIPFSCYAFVRHQTLRHVQTAAVPAILRDRRSDFLLASHTGSGKTLAYLLPIGV